MMVRRSGSGGGVEIHEQLRAPGRQRGGERGEEGGREVSPTALALGGDGSPKKATVKEAQAQLVAATASRNFASAGSMNIGGETNTVRALLAASDLVNERTLVPNA